MAAKSFNPKKLSLVQPLVKFDHLSLKAVSEAAHLEGNLRVIQDLQEGYRFFVVERYEGFANVTAHNLSQMLVVTETGRAMPIRILELITGYSALAGSTQRANLFSMDTPTNWEEYHRKLCVEYDDFEGFMTEVYGKQFAGLEVLYKWEYNAFRLALLVGAGQVTSLTVQDSNRGLTVSSHNGSFAADASMLIFYLADFCGVDWTGLLDEITTVETVLFAFPRAMQVEVAEWTEPLEAPIRCGQPAFVVDKFGRAYKAEVTAVEFNRKGNFWAVEVLDPFSHCECWFQFSEEPMLLTEATWYDGGYARRA